MKKVSIIIPYNENRGYLADAVESAEFQTYPNTELILSYGPRSSCSQNINEGFARSTGDYIKILAEDDILPPNSIADLVAGIAGYDFICGNAEYFGDYSQIDIGRVTDLDEMLIHNQIHGGTVLYTRRCFEQTGGFDDTLITGEEYDFHLRLLSMGFKLGYVDSIVHLYRVHQFQKSTYTDAEGKELRHSYIQEIRERYERIG